MATFQMRVHGRWSDVEIPGFKDLKSIGNGILSMGRKPECPELRFFANLVRDNWGAGAFRDENGNPTTTLSPQSPNCYLKLDHMYVVSFKHEVLKLQLYYQFKQEGVRQTKSGKTVTAWTKEESCVEVTLMAAS